MKIDVHKRELTLEYRTDQFLHEFEVERSEWNDETDTRENYKINRTARTQLEVELSLTERASLEIPVGSMGRPQWYSIYIDHFDDLKPDGFYEQLRAHGESVDIHPEPYTGKNVIPEVLRKMKTAFPDHNVGLKIKIHSSLRKAVDPGDMYFRDHYDLRNIFRPVLRELTGYLVQQGLQEIGGVQ